MPNSLRVDKVVEHPVSAEFPEGRLEFFLKEGDAPLSAVRSNDSLIFPGGRPQFIEDLRAFEASLGAREKLFLLYLEIVKSDPSLRLTSLKQRENSTITIDFAGASKGISIG